MLERSVSGANGKGNHWLAWLHLGVMRLEAGDRGAARQAWERSLELCRNAWALRNLAVLECAGDDKSHWPWHPTGVSLESSLRACEKMRQAWEVGPRTVPFAMEYARLLFDAAQYEQLWEFAHSAPENIRQHERLRLLAGSAALRLGRLDEIEALFTQEFATIREGEVGLTDLWFEYHARRIAAAEKVPLDEKLRERVRREFPAPRNIDYRMSYDVK